MSNADDIAIQTLVKEIERLHEEIESIRFKREIMNNQWLMTIPVISTLHIPGERPFDGDDFNVAEYREGYFVLIPPDYEEEFSHHPWFQKVCKHVRQTLGVTACEVVWVRFDADGDEVDLPRFYTEWGI